jgi:hypothetical protein
MKPRRFALLGLAIAAAAQALAADAALDSRAVWQPGAGFMRSVRERCVQAASGRYGECLIEQMADAGASPQAVAFSRALLRESGETAILRGLRAAGPIAIAALEYPLRANENRGWLIVNGDPPRLDVDDDQFAPREALAHDATWKALLAAHPQLALFPADRSGAWPAVETLPDGATRVVVPYRLLDGCHACARLGAASVGFEFDPAGAFVGPTLLGVETAAR